LLTRSCDAYARFFSPRGALRKKMVLLLAILELTPPYFHFIDAADTGGWFMFFIRVMGRGMVMVFCLLPALFTFLPLQLLLNVTGPKRRQGKSHA